MHLALTVGALASCGPDRDTAAELETTYAVKIFESTLGTEFSAGDLYGLLDGRGAAARITNMWAGASCTMR